VTLDNFPEPHGSGKLHGSFFISLYTFTKTIINVNMLMTVERAVHMTTSVSVYHLACGSKRGWKGAIVILAIHFIPLIILFALMR
jgi:hypothetical protein